MSGVARGLCVLAALVGCGKRDDTVAITLWHTMLPAGREVLREQIAAFEAAHPGVRVRQLYKEPEELRSSFQAAALAGIGPELVYGPSDVMDPFQRMAIVRDLRAWFSREEQDAFVAGALTFLPARDGSGRQELLQIGDSIGNHLVLVYNRKFVKEPPRTTDDLVRIAVANTIDAEGDGRMDRYGLVWNYTEPFFLIPFLTGFGGWVFAEGPELRPSLDTPQVVAAMRFVAELRNVHHVIPANCDYEAANSHFKSGTAAMLINGDWSWGEYLDRPELEVALAPLPTVTATGLPMAPMAASKGYSLNANASGRAADAAIEFIRAMTSAPAQRKFMARLRTLPSRKELLDDPLLAQDPSLRASAAQIRVARPMPVVAELRAIWDSMRPHYQALLGGSVSAEQAAAGMQKDAEEKIRLLHRNIRPGWSAYLVYVLGAVLFLVAAVVCIRRLAAFRRDFAANRIAYLFVLPTLLVLLVTIVFPFVYNIALSLSNMSLANFRTWQIVGFQNYGDVLGEAAFLPVLGKTIVWTAVNVFFHVSIGVLLAVVLNGPVRGKSIYRVLLIIPWAVPAYITALTWRGMFDYEYGAVNLIANTYLSMPMVNWLGSPLEAFIACILTNVWLGFPFMMVIALGGLQGIPQELYEAARIDGASRVAQFFHITLPLLKPVLVPAVTLGAIWTFNNLNVVWLVSNAGEPSDKTHILVSYVYKAVFNLYRYGYGAALSMVIFAVLLLFSVVFLRKTKATQSVY